MEVTVKIMRVRMIKGKRKGLLFFDIGEIAYLPYSLARQWIKDGYAVEDRTIDVPEVR